LVDKDYKYKTLLSRIDDAMKDKFYLEATWIVYAILEDRLVSALNESGGAVDKKGKAIRMLGNKLVELKVRHKEKKSVNLRKAFYGDMFDRLGTWKDMRNELMHAMADETKGVVELDEMAFEAANIGRDLAREFCAACRRYKKLNRS